MPATSYTLATLKTELGEDLQDASFVHHTETILLKRINNRMADFTRRTLCRRYTWEVDLVASQGEYDLSTLSPRLADIYSVACPQSAGDTSQYQLERVELAELERRYPEWRTEANNWPRVYARFSEGPHGILIHPRPASSQEASVRAGTIYATSNSGFLINITGIGTTEATAAVGALVGVRFLVGNLRIDGAALSTDLASSGDSLETAGIPIEWQHVIKAGVLADCWGDLSVPIAQVEKGAKKAAEYEDGVQQAIRKFQTSFQGRPGTTGRARFV
jgi:hypothetical protein